MSFGFTRRTRGEMFNYSRPNSVTEVTPTGSIVYGPNEARTKRDEWGHFLGMVFGDGGSAELPSQVNPHWVDESSPMTIFAIAQAPVGVTWFKCGDVEIQGVGGHKLHIIELPSGSVMEDRIQIFPNANNIPEECYLMLVKYYNETDIPLGEEGEAMSELNSFMVGDWN